MERQPVETLGWSYRHESLRLAVVEGLALLDTSPHERFDRITRLARQTFGVSVAEINLLHADRQFTKSPQTLGQSPNSPRQESFCTEAIRSAGVTVVEDATLDARFASKATVTGERHIRFYAGVPLMVSGHAVGTLCLADTVPRRFGDADRALLAQIGVYVEHLLTDAQSRRRSA